MGSVPGFSREEVERARAYHRPAYVVWGAGAALGLGTLAAASFTALGRWLAAPLEGLPRAAFAALYAALVAVLLAVLRLPLSAWRGLVHERRWGFSTQSFQGWLWDWAKARAVGVALTAGTLAGLAEVAARFPGAWPLVAAPGAALLVLVLTLAGPVVFEPLFHRFRPLADPGLAAAIRDLAGRAGAPVREVLVADASRRTRKENAYVSGLAGTRRVVVFDTLLERAEPAAVRLVVAHELGHWRARHVAKGAALGALGAAGTVVVLWALLSGEGILRALGASGPTDPHLVPFVLLVVGGLQLLGAPLGAAVSRRWEREADRAAVELTGDPEGFARAERDLALRNLSDLSPPRALYLLLFTHPLPQERIAAARTLGEGGGRARGTGGPGG